MLTFHVLSQRKVVKSVSWQDPYLNPGYNPADQREREAQQNVRDAELVVGRSFAEDRLRQVQGDAQRQQVASELAAHAAWVRNNQAQQMFYPRPTPQPVQKPRRAAPPPKPLTPEEMKAAYEARKREAAEVLRRQAANREAMRELASRQRRRKFVARTCGALVIIGLLPALMSIGAFGSLINPVTILYGATCWVAWYLDKGY